MTLHGTKESSTLKAPCWMQLPEGFHQYILRKLNHKRFELHVFIF